MRLIDADAFRDKFDPDTVTGNTMRKIIEGEPTAYDMDKVVNLMETNLETMRKVISETFDKEISYSIQRLFMTYTNTLIISVKSRGIK